MAQGTRRKGRIFIYVGLILILGLVLIWAVLRNQFSPQSPSANGSQSDMVNIVVSSQAVTRGTEITESVLTTIPYPKSNLPDGTFYSDVSQVVGKRAKTDLEARVPITSAVVVDTTSVEGSPAAFKIPQGMVAVSIPINRLSSVAYAIQPGDHVNVISTMLFVDIDQNFQSILPNHTATVTGPYTPPEGGPSSVVSAITSPEGAASNQGRGELDSSINQPVYVVPSEVQRPRMVSQTLLQDAVVLQVGDFNTTTAATTTDTTAAGAQAEQQTTNTKPDLITLIVTPQDAVTLNYFLFTYVNTEGSTTNPAMLTLALRGAGDQQRVQTEAVTLQYLMDQYKIPLPAKLPYGLEPRVNSLQTPALANDAPAAK